MLKEALVPSPPDVGILVYVCVLPPISEVNAPPNVTTFPVMSVTVIDCPSPLSNTSPALMPNVESTVRVVSPIAAPTVNVAVTTTPPSPVTAVICAPVLIPVPLIGAPIGGMVPVNPITSDPAAVAKLVVIVPLEPYENTLKVGLPTADPV